MCAHQINRKKNKGARIKYGRLRYTLCMIKKRNNAEMYTTATCICQMCHADMFAIEISPCISFLCAQNKPVKLQSQHQNAFAQYTVHTSLVHSTIYRSSAQSYTPLAASHRKHLYSIRINDGLSVGLSDVEKRIGFNL